MRRLTVVFIVLIMLTALCACGHKTKQSNSAAANIVGKYMLSEVVDKYGNVMTAAEFDEDEFSITLREDGTGVVVSEGDQSEIFTWKQSGDNVTIYYQGMQESFTVTGNSITLENDKGRKMIFKK